MAEEPEKLNERRKSTDDLPRVGWVPCAVCGGVGDDKRALGEDKAGHICPHCRGTGQIYVVVND
jgi:hypothetical protein